MLDRIDASNNPLRFIDPKGLEFYCGNCRGEHMQKCEDKCCKRGEKVAICKQLCWGVNPYSVCVSYCTCGENKCPPCTPPIGTIAYRLDTEHSHGGLKPHVQLYMRQQNPGNCRCFWKPIGFGPPPPPPGSIPMP